MEQVPDDVLRLVLACIVDQALNPQWATYANNTMPVNIRNLPLLHGPHKKIHANVNPYNTGLLEQEGLWDSAQSFGSASKRHFALWKSINDIRTK